MRKELFDKLCCPECRGELGLNGLTTNPNDPEDVLEGELVCMGCSRTYPIQSGIPRLLPDKFRSDK